MVNVIKGPFDVSVYHPFLPFVWSSGEVDFADGIMASSAWAEPVTCALERGFPRGFERIFDSCLQAAVNNRWDAQGSEFAIGFRYVHPFGWLGFPGLIGSKVVDEFAPGCWCFYHQLVYASRMLASIGLCYSSHAYAGIRVTPKHEFLERVDLFVVVALGCPIDALSKVTNVPMGGAPVDGVPIGWSQGSVC
jgi:hypothetical protein